MVVQLIVQFWLQAWVQNNYERAILLPSREENINSLCAAVQHNFRRTLLVPSREKIISSLGAAVQHNFRCALLPPSWEKNINSLGRDAGTTLKLGGKRLPGSKVLPKTKNSHGLSNYFLGETQVHVQKQTEIKMNDMDSPELGGGAPPQLPSCGGKLPPLPPGSRVPEPGHCGIA